MARGIKFGAREAYAVVKVLPDGSIAEEASGLYTYKRHAAAQRNERNRERRGMPNLGQYKVVPVVLTWHLEAAE